MAQGIGNFIDRIQIGTDDAHQIAIGSSAYAVCTTAANNAAKEVNIPGFALNTGTTIHIKFNNANSAASPTLNVSNTGAKAIMQYGTTNAGTAEETSGWRAGAVLTLTYDGTNWIRDQGYNTNTWRGIQNNLTSDSITDSLSAVQGKVLKGLIDGMDATTPAASGNATAFIDSITQTDGKITSITKKNIPTASTNTAGIIKIGTTANDAAAGNHVHSYNDLTDKINEDIFVKKRALSISTDLELVKLLPGMYDHTSNMNNTLPTSWGTVLNIHGNYNYGSLIAAETDNVMYYRTYYYDTDDSWTWRGEWQTIAHATQSVNNIGSATQPIYMTNKGVIVAGTALKALAYKDSLTSSDIPDNAANTTGNAATATTATYIKCTDTRSAALDPTDLKAVQGVRFDFKAKGTINLTATDNYAGVMSFMPYSQNSDWSGGNAHQIAFNSEGLHWRNGSASWGNWYQILDSNNTAAGSNNTATLAWSTTYTIAKINGTDIKFTTMAKPSYAFTDLTTHPTTLSGYGITDAKIASGIITLGSNTITPVTSVNGHTGSSVSVTAADLDLSKAMRFIGVATVAITDGSTTDPVISGYSTKTAGDVIIDKDSSREYVWSTTGKWELLGGDSSYKVTQSTVDSGAAATNKWIARIQQNANGVITTTMGTLDTSGTWSGNAKRLGKSDAVALNSFTHGTDLIYTYAGGGNGLGDKPSGVDAFGVISLKTADGWYGQLLVSSNTSSGIYWRTATSLSGGWNKILDSSNTSSGTNNASTLTWGTTYTIAKINDTDIKFTTMAKPSYAFTDLTAHPTTLSGYGITDAASSNHSHTLKIGNKSLSVNTSEQTWALHDILKTSTDIGTGTSWDQYEPGVYYVASNAVFTGTNNPENTNTNNGISPYRYGQLIVSRASTGGVAQFYISHHDSDNASYGIHYRTGWNNTYVAKWSVLLDSHNYTKYTVTKTGDGASGTWGISITGSSASCTGNAATATAIQTAGTTAQFYRGDNSWSNTIKQTANAVLGVDTNLKIGITRKDLNFDIGNGSGTGINDGYAGGITWGNGTSAYAGIYYQSSGSYGSRLIFGTTSSYANGAYARMIVQNNGYVGIGTLTPSELLHVTGNLLLGNSGSKAIYYQGTNSKNAMITFLDNTADAYGNGIKIGGGGVVVVGAGESAANLSVTAGSETLYLTSDGAINIEAGGDTIANRVGMQVTAAGNIIPVKAEAANNNKQNLGASDNRWAKLYIGNADNHGDAYTPIYWNDGVPTAVTLIQYCEFTIGSGKTGVKLAHAAFTAASYVTQIVVTDGESNLNSAIAWENAAGYINLTCSAVTSGAVSGYILVSRGGAITATATDIT